MSKKNYYIYIIERLQNDTKKGSTLGEAFFIFMVRADIQRRYSQVTKMKIERGKTTEVARTLTSNAVGLAARRWAAGRMPGKEIRPKEVPNELRPCSRSVILYDTCFEFD